MEEEKKLNQIDKVSEYQKAHPIALRKRGAERIRQRDKPKLLSIFFTVLGNSQFLTRPIREEIKNKWKEEMPHISDHSWRTQLHVIETQYYEKVEQWNAGSIAGKINKQIADAQDDMQSAQTVADLRRASTILNSLTKSNELIAKINHLGEQAPVANILIGTNINEIELLKKLNTKSVINIENIETIETTNQGDIHEES